MENAVDALKIGFAVFVFVMALSLSMYMFTQARTTADLVLHSSDITGYMQYEVATSGSENRIVGLETIVPTLYKYYKENYTVIFRNSDESFMPIYTTQTDISLWSTGYHNQYYGGTNTSICSFDVDEETRRHEPWTGNTEYYKQNLDAFLGGGLFIYPTGTGESYDYGEGFMEAHKNDQFIESLGEYSYNVSNSQSGFIQDKKKRVIIYTLL